MGKLVLLTGEPRVGKSTVLAKLIEILGRESCGGFVAKEQSDGQGGRAGFLVETLDGGSGLLASKEIAGEAGIKRVGDYGVAPSPNFLETEALKSLCAAIDNKKYIIIDEIGKMQLFSEKFREAVAAAVSSPKTVVATIVKDSRGDWPQGLEEGKEWVNAFKSKAEEANDAQTIEITPRNRESSLYRILSALEPFAEDRELQGKLEKSRRYTAERERFSSGKGFFDMVSEHGRRRIEHDGGGWRCGCDFYLKRGACSHILACMQLPEPW